MAKLKRIKLGETRPSFNNPKKKVTDFPTIHIHGKSLGLEKVGEEALVSAKVRLRSVGVDEDKKMSYTFDVLEISRGDK